MRLDRRVVAAAAALSLSHARILRCYKGKEEKGGDKKKGKKKIFFSHGKADSILEFSDFVEVGAASWIASQRGLGVHQKKLLVVQIVAVVATTQMRPRRIVQAQMLSSNESKE